MEMSNGSQEIKRHPLIHPNLMIFIRFILINLALLFIYRVIFLVAYLKLFDGTTFLGVLLSFIHGLRFDISIIFLIHTIVFIALFLPGRIFLTKTFYLVVKILFFISICLQISIMTIDLLYYAHVNTRLAEDILKIEHDIWSMLRIVFTSYIGFIVGFLVSLVPLWLLFSKLLQSEPPERGTIGGKKEKALLRLGRSLIYILLLIIVAIFSIRGGFQSKPLRVSHAFINDRIILGHLTLNGVFTITQAVLSPGGLLDVEYEEDVAISTVRNLVRDTKTEFLDNGYPMLRKHKGEQREAKAPNVVILIMESWSAHAVGALGSKYDVTPFFDKLSKEGYLFKSFFSVGQRSTDGAVSILYSFPSFSRLTTVGRVYEQNQMIGIGSILKQEGYATIFICGARRGSMGLDSFAARAGFDRYIAKDNFDLPKESFDEWGVFDEYAFERAHEEFNQMQEPFLGVVYTLNPHTPFAVPSKRFERIKDDKNAPFLNALHYSDWTLENFFKQARKSDYFSNTLFVIVADHTEGLHGQSALDLYRIPCLFYFPGKITPGINSNPGSQLDILPSIVDVLGLSSIHSSFGRSLFTQGKRYALFARGNILGWVRNDHVLLHTIQSPVGLYNFRTDTTFSKDLLEEKPSMVKDHEKELFSLLKSATALLLSNRIAPIN
jgi:phosphoglycerol transferase MdoB-like AlkP superfamily enzyme